MANPFKNLFKSKYTTFYSVDDLNEEQKNYIRDEYAKYQANPEQFDEQYGTAIAELENRLRTPDPLLSTYESIEDDTTGRGAFQQRRTVGDKRLRVAAEAKERKKLKTSYLYGQIEDYEPKNSFTDVQSVIDHEDSAKALENKINEEKEQKRQKYTELIGIDPFQNSRAAFDKWMSDNPELVDEVIESSPKIKEDSSVAYVELLRKFQNSVAKGTLEKDFYGERPKEDKIRAEKNRRQLEKMPLNQQTLRPISDEQSSSLDIKIDESKIVKIPDEILNTNDDNTINNYIEFIEKEKERLKFEPRQRSLADAWAEVDLTDVIPFKSSSMDAAKLVTALSYLAKFKLGEQLSPEQIDFLKEYSNEERHVESTIPAQAFDVFIQSLPMAGEILATYGVPAALIGRATRSLASRQVKKEIKDYLEKSLLIDTSSKVIKKTAKTGLVVSGASLANKGYIEFGKMDDKLSLEKQLPQFEFANEGLLITEEGMDKHTADKQGKFEASSMFLVETLGGKALNIMFPWFGKKASNFINKTYNKLSPGQSEVVLTQSISNVLSDAIERVVPKLNMNKEQRVLVRQYLQGSLDIVAFDGLLAEMGEERLEEIVREVAFGLSQAKDSDGNPLLPGFDNPQYIDNIMRDLADGDLGKVGERLAVEIIALTGTGMALRAPQASYSSMKEYGKNQIEKKKEERFKEDFESIATKRDELKEKNKETEEELKTLQNKKKPTKKDKKRKEELIEDRRMSEAISVIETIVKENPKLKNEADIEIIDEVGEVTAEQLEEQGTSMEEEGLPKDTKKARFLGKTFLKNNLKLGLELRRGANLDTAVEEYFGLAYRGGLTDKQSDAFEEYYDRYTTDIEFRTKVNEKINELIPDSVSDVTQTLSEQELFEKEGKAKFYESQEKPKTFVDKLFNGIKNNFNKVFGNITLDDKIRDVYEKAGARKVKIKAERAQKLEERRAKRQERQEEKQEKREAKETAKEEKREAKQDRKRKRLRPGVEPTLDERFDDAQYEEVAEPELEDLPDIVQPKPKEIKERKKQAKKIKSKPRLFNFLNRRARKLARKKIETISPVAIREVKIKLEQQAPKQVIPDDPRQPLEILRDILGDEQFQDLTGIYTGPIQQIETIEPRIIETLKEKFETLPYESLDFFDVIPEKKQEEILKEVEKVVGKETIKPIRDLKKPKKPGVRVREDETFEDATYDDVPKPKLDKLPKIKKPKKKSKTSFQLIGNEKKLSSTVFFTGKEKAPKFKNISELSRFITNRTKKIQEDLGVDLTEDTPENNKLIGEVLIDEINEELKRDWNASDWYSTKTKNAVDIIKLIDPSISEEKNEMAFKFALAITSNGKAVGPNLKLALENYEYFKENGVFNENLEGGGKEQAAMRKAMKLHNDLKKEWGEDKLNKFLNTEFTVKEIEETGLKKISGELVDTKVYGSSIFGPKVGGAFYQNLMGNYDMLTMDLHFTRNMERIIGNLLPTRDIKKQLDAFKSELRKSKKARNTYNVTKDTYKDEKRLAEIAKDLHNKYSSGGFKDKTNLNKKAKNLDERINKPKEAPQGGKERNRFREIMKYVVENSQASSIADAQAILWFPQKRFYGKFGITGESINETDYEIEATKLARQRNVSDSRIQGVLGAKQPSIAKESSKDVSKKTNVSYQLTPTQQRSWENLKYTKLNKNIRLNVETEIGDEFEKVVRIDDIKIPLSKRLQGLGKKEVDNVKNWASKNNADLIAIEAKRESIPFWEKQGFEILDQGAEISTGYFNIKPQVSYQLKPTGKPLDIYDEITGKESFGSRPKGPRKLVKYWESGIIPISTLLKRIDPKIYSFLLKHQYSVAIRTNQAKEDIILLDKMIKRMSKKDQVAFKLAMLNSDGTTLRDLAQKYDKKEDFTKALSNVRQVLDELRDQLIEVGEEVGFIEEYYPRKVTDYDGLITELYGDSEVKALIEKQIAEKEKNEERKLSPSEKADLINKLIRGYSYIKSRPSFIKTRKLDKITLKMADFYEDPIIQLNNHMERVVERIENKRFFGASETSDESLGDFIQKIIDSGISLTDAQQKDLMRIFGAYFNFEPTNSTLGAIKTGTYGILLGRFTNTITQMQDMVYGIYENKWNQIRTIKNLVNYFKGKIVETERVKRADVGADMIGQEFKIETKSGFEKFMNGTTNIILTGSGFKLMDGLGKSVLINSAIQKYKTKAKKNRLSKKDKDYLKTLFGNSYDQVIKELKEDTSPSEYTENELFIGYATLLKYQPIGRTEVPLKYLESKGGRILYMLRTFSIKQFNVLRDESMDILTGKQVGNKKMALFNLFYLVGLMTMAGAGGDEIKDWIKGKSSSIWDNVQDNLLKIILINKYWTSKVQREAAYKGYIKSTFDNVRNLLISVPPIDVTIDFIQGVTEFIFKEENDKKKSKLTRYIPWIGDVVYSRREWSEFTGVGGRGKDDYTYRELNSLYKKSYTEQKELDKRELRVYTQSLLDALNYPQTKLRKGKEVRKINIEKHYNHLNRKYNIQIGKNSKGKYEKLN